MKVRYLLMLPLSLAWVSTATAQVHEVTPTVETEPVPSSGDAADDSAVWIHPNDPARSVLIGTDKQSGLAVYDLDGSEIQFLEVGDLNNVDVRYGLELGGERVDIAAAGNRTSDTISVFAVDPQSRMLTDVTADQASAGLTVYGSCLYRSATTGKFYSFVNSKDGEIVQHELADDGTGKVAATEVRRFSVESQTEGCVADDENGLFFIGEEGRGIWRFGAEPQDSTDGMLIAQEGDEGLTADVEGLTLYVTSDGGGYLLASSQGDNTYAIFERGGDHGYLGSFRIVGADGIDGTSDTDGIEVSHANLGEAFPSGVFVAQDGANEGGNQNYKLVPWESIAQAAGLVIDTAYDPRGSQPDSPGEDAGGDGESDAGEDSGQGMDAGSTGQDTAGDTGGSSGSGAGAPDAGDDSMGSPLAEDDAGCSCASGGGAAGGTALLGLVSLLLACAGRRVRRLGR